MHYPQGTRPMAPAPEPLPEIAGYASVFGQCDGGGDIVVAGAYGAALARMKAQGQKVAMLWQHDPKVPIGLWDEIREDAHGLWVKGRLLPQVPKGREAASLLAAGAIDGLSIGYRTRRARRDAQGHRHLVELELWEISLVTFPMQSGARVQVGAPSRLGMKSGLLPAPAAPMTQTQALHQLLGAARGLLRSP